jgi:hypothetical protein
MGPSLKDCQVAEENQIPYMVHLRFEDGLFSFLRSLTAWHLANCSTTKVNTIFSHGRQDSLVLPGDRTVFYQGRFGMAGKIRQMIDLIINQRAKDNPMLERVIKTKLMLKGVNPKKYTLESPDDPAVILKLERMMHMFQ